MPLDSGKILKAIRSDSSANRVDPEAPNSNSNVSTLIKWPKNVKPISSSSQDLKDRPR